MKKTLLRNLIIAILVIIIIFSTMTRTYAIGVINSVELADLSLSNSADDKSSNIGSSTATSLLAGLEEASSDLKNMVSITSNGYELQGNYALRIIQALEKASVDTYAFGFRDEDYDIKANDNTSQTYTPDSQLKNVLDKYIRTELKNMLPNIGSYAHTAINGNVKIKRYTSKFGRYNASNSGGTSQENGMDFGEGITLEYVPYATLKKYSELTARSYAETQKYLKYFSINPQGMKLCILVSEENYVWDYDNITPNRAIDDSGTKDPAGVELLPDDYATATRVESTFKIKEYEYLNLLEQTATPVNYFLAMQMISQNEDFMNELLDKCNSDSKIEIGFLESTETDFIHYNYGTDAKDVIRGGKLSTYQVDTWNRWDCCKDITTTTTDSEGNVTSHTEEKPHSGKELVNKQIGDYIGNEDEVYATCLKYAGYELKDFLNVKIKNTGDLYLIRAETWNMNYQLKPKVGGIERPFKKLNSVKKIDIKPDPVPYVERLEPYEERRIGRHNCDANHYSNLYEWKNTHFYIYEGKAEWTNKYNIYTVIDGEYKTDFIIGLIKKYPQVQNNFTSAASLLFSLLEQNGNTQELERFMRTVITQVTGNQYLTENTQNLNYDFAVGLSEDSMYSFNINSNDTSATPKSYKVDTDSSASSSNGPKMSGGSGKTKWTLSKLTTIKTTDQDGEFISNRQYYYFKQGTGTNICGRASLAICLSGLGIKNPSTGQPYTPTEISPNNTNAWFSWMSSVGATGVRYTNNLKAKLIEQLSTGNPAIVHIKANSDPSNIYNTKGGHFIAVVGLKNEGDALAYVLDPGSSRATRTENYININKILAYADEVRTVKLK